MRRPSDQPFEQRIALVDDEGDRHTFDGPTLIDLARHRATRSPSTSSRIAPSARLFINARGLLNVINELNFEDYLYGVVPAEMGPSIYDEVEALKAQAVAARTYAIRNLRPVRERGLRHLPRPGLSGVQRLRRGARAARRAPCARPRD